MSFTIICNKCGSRKVSVDGDMDNIAFITCKDCGQKQYSDEFPDED